MKNVRKLISPVVFIILIIYLSLQSCVRDNLDFNKLTDQVIWSPGWAIPLAYGSIHISDMIKEMEDTLEFSDPDENGRRFLNFIYSNDSILSIQVNEFLEISEQEPLHEELSLGEMEIDDINYSHQLSLWDIVTNIDVSTGAFLLAHNGQMEKFPEITLQNAGVYDLDPMNDFSYLILSEGQIEYTVENRLPVAIQQLNMILKNKSDNSILGTMSFEDIPAGESRVESIDLSGKTLTNQIYFELSSISSPGSGNELVLINLDNIVNITVRTHSFKVVSGEAIISDQLIEINDLSFGLDFSEINARITEIKLKSTKINYDISTPLPLDMIITLKLPTVTIDNNMVEVPIFIPGTSSTVNGTFDMDRAIMDLSTDPDQPYNRIPLLVSIEILGANSFVAFSSEDRFSMDFGFENMGFSYAKGYFGQIELGMEESEMPLPLELLSNIDGGFSLSNPSLDILIYSSLGIPIALDLDFSGESSNGVTQNINYTGPQMILPYPLTIEQGYTEGVLDYNKANSSIDELIGLPPSILRFSGSGTSNPNGFNDYSNFITDTSKINFGIQMNFPLSIKAENLIFQDTMPLGANNNEGMEDPENEETDLNFDFIENASLYMDLTHDLPVNINFELVLFDSLNQIKYDTIQADLLVAAIYNESGNLVELSHNKEIIELTGETMNNFSNTNSLILKAKISTYDPGDGTGPRYVKIFSDYSLDFKLGLKADLDFNNSDK